MCQNLFLRTALMVTVFASSGFTKPNGQFLSNTGLDSRASSYPCSTSPCGPNTSCHVKTYGIAQCRCLDGFVPDGNTINGCKPQCTRDNDCPDDYRCQATKCVKVCGYGACGISADCNARNHRAICECPRGYRGQPEIRCTRKFITVPTAHEPAQRLTIGTCRAHNDCPYIHACYQLQCVDPCEGACGVDAKCRVVKHKPICECPQGYTGHPLESCRPLYVGDSSPIVAGHTFRRKSALQVLV